MSDVESKRSSLPWFIAGSVAVLLLIVGGFFVFITASQRETPNPVASSAAPTTSPQSDSICGLEGFEDENSLVAAPEAEWSIVGTIAAPSSADAGPGLQQPDGFRSCYSQTAEGAVLAAANFVAIGSDSGLAEQQLDLVAAGPGREAIADRLTGGSGSSTRANIVGFNVMAYSADAATIDLAVSLSDGRMGSLPIKLIWEAGDWKVVLTDSGEMPLAPAVIASLGGYIPWGV